MNLEAAMQNPNYLRSVGKRLSKEGFPGGSGQ